MVDGRGRCEGKKQMKDLSKLPSVPFSNLNELPACVAIYYVSDHNGNVIYIGQTRNLKYRFGTYNRLRIFYKEECSLISWDICKENELIKKEKAEIILFKPKLNIAHNINNYSIPEYRVTSINIYPDDERCLDIIKKHLAGNSNQPAIRFALKMCSESITNKKEKP